MQDPNDILTDSVTIWSAEWLENAKPHHEKIARFLKGKLAGRVLDIGERNPLTVQIEKENGIKIDNTEEDLDMTLSLVRYKEYDTIICSHVIEHLFNPLLFLWHIKGLMADDGKLYLIAPVKPYWITPAKCHFHEMNHQNMKRLLARAGLNIVDWQEYSVPIKWTFSLRNWLRRLYKEYSIITLTK